MSTLRSEWRKLVSVRMWIGLAVAAMGFTALNAGFLLALSNQEETIQTLDSAASMRAFYGSAGSAALFALVLGILAITSEYRHQTITSTLLATPNRLRLVAAKMASSAILAAVLALLCFAIVLVASAIGVAWRGIGPIVVNDILAILGGTVLGFAVYAVLGVGFGSLVRNQIGAIVAALVWVLLIEGLIVAFLPSWGQWLPGGALSGVLQAQTLSGSGYLPALPAAALLLGYAAVFGLVAVRTTMRRDIT